METNLLLKAKVEINGYIECITGLHIGSSREKLEIGEVDSPVVKDIVTREPYIPGSSLKGAMRSRLEIATAGKKLEEVVKNTIRIHICNNNDCNVCSIFGRPAEYVSDAPTRLIVTDSYPDDYTKRLIKEHGLEVKFENQLDRITAAANPRQIERVPKGSRFQLFMIYSIYKVDDIQLLKDVFRSMKLVEDSYLGGNGSRGYGRVKFYIDKIIIKPREYYMNIRDVKKIQLSPNNIDYILANFDNILANDIKTCIDSQ